MALKENIRVDGKRDIQTKVMTTTLFALFAEVERDLISERTREGLARARSSGRKLGRPKGLLGVSRLDGKEGSATFADPLPQTTAAPPGPLSPPPLVATAGSAAGAAPEPPLSFPSRLCA